MPKPQYTYIRANRIAKIKHQAKITKDKGVGFHLSAQGREFQRILEQNQVDLREIQRIINQSRALNEQPTAERDRRIEALIEVIQKLDDLADEIKSHKEFNTELGGSASQFMVRVNGVNLNGVGLSQALLAITVFLAMLERTYHKFSSGR
jgi:hypothetical protein